MTLMREEIRGCVFFLFSVMFLEWGNIYLERM